MPLASFKQIIASAAHGVLEPQGFKKKALVFSRVFPDVVQFIALQSSTSSTTQYLKVTVNLGVLVPSLCDSWVPKDVWSAQWQQRLGYLFPESGDRWWEVQSHGEASFVSAEIVAGLRAYGLPKLDALVTKSALADLWRSGQSPGVTELQRKRYLERLNNEQTA